MGWSLGFIENGTEEVADAARFQNSNFNSARQKNVKFRFPNIRLYKIERNTSDTEMEDQVEIFGFVRKRIEKGEPRRGWTSWAGTSSDWPEDTDWGEGIWCFHIQ